MDNVEYFFKSKCKNMISKIPSTLARKNYEFGICTNKYKFDDLIFYKLDIYIYYLSNKDNLQHKS